MIQTEEQILDLIKEEVAPQLFEVFLKIFFLYSKNIISYCEFVDLCEPILIKLDKNVCCFLQNAIENREKSLVSKNPFNLK